MRFCWCLIDFSSYNEIKASVTIGGLVGCRCDLWASDHESGSNMIEVTFLFIADRRTTICARFAEPTSQMNRMHRMHRMNRMHRMHRINHMRRTICARFAEPTNQINRMNRLNRMNRMSRMNININQSMVKQLLYSYQNDTVGTDSPFEVTTRPRTAFYTQRWLDDEGHSLKPSVCSGVGNETTSLPRWRFPLSGVILR